MTIIIMCMGSWVCASMCEHVRAYVCKYVHVGVYIVCVCACVCACVSDEDRHDTPLSSALVSC